MELEQKQHKTRTEYNRKYMNEYIKKQPKITCDVCLRMYNKHQKYQHIKQKNHILHQLLKQHQLLDLNL